jgi:hypothetical protein
MKSGSFLDGRYEQTNFHSNPTKNAPFSYLKYKNFSAGRGTPLPAPPPSAPRFSRLRCSMGPPRKNPGYGPAIHLSHSCESKNINNEPRKQLPAQRPHWITTAVPQKSAVLKRTARAVWELFWRRSRDLVASR